MKKVKKSPKVQYGIEITKPWSKEMYDHNDKVSEEMKKNIIKKWDTIVKRLDMDQDWNLLSDDSEIVKLQKGICYSGYGDGFTLEDVAINGRIDDSIDYSTLVNKEKFLTSLNQLLDKDFHSM